MKGFNDLSFIALLGASLAVGCSEGNFSGSSEQAKKANKSAMANPLEGEQPGGAEGGAGTDGDPTGQDGTGGNNGDFPDDTNLEPTEPGQISQSFTQQNQFVVDIVFVFDTSTSMKDEKTFIEQNMASFMNNLASASLDATVTVIGKVTNKTDSRLMGLTFNFPNTLPAGKFAQVDQYVHSTDALGHLNRYFSGALATPMPLRQDVPTEVVIVTDDDGHNTVNNPYNVPKNTAAEFVMPAGKKLTVNAVVGLVLGQSSTNPGCNIEHVGNEHMALSKQTGGTVFDLCNDWNAMLKELTDKIVVRNSGFVLEKIPDTSKPIMVYLNGKLVGANNYTIDAANKVLKFKDTYIVPTGANIKVVFTEKK